LTLRAFNHLLWPQLCLACKNLAPEDKNLLCPDCATGLKENLTSSFCPRCGCQVSAFAILDQSCPECSSRTFAFDRIAPCGVYTGVLRDMILAFKHGRTELMDTLARLLNSTLAQAAFADQIDLFIPIPLHWLRRLTRGYNQSLLLTKGLDAAKGKISTDLVRIRHTKQQPTMRTFAARAKNVAGAFAVRKDHNLKAKTICLIDDIKTSGATLNECAKTLKQAGASKVFALVLATASPQSP